MKETTNRFLKSIVLTGALAAVGWVADALGAPWVLAIPYVLLLFRTEFRPLLLSHELVVVALMAFGIGTAIGTFSQDMSLYSSLWFVSTIGLLALNTLLCLIVRMNRERFFWSALVHVSVLVVLVGGVVKSQMKEEGMVNLLIGQTATSMMEMENGRTTGREVPLPFPIRLNDFRVEFYDAKAELYVYDLTRTHEKPARAVEVSEREPFTVLDTTIQIVGKKKERFVPAPNHPPIEREALEVKVGEERLAIPETGEGVRHGDLGFVLHEARGAPKLYESDLAVLDDKGETVQSQLVVVNAPLIRDGYWFYQSNWGESRNGIYSGIQVVHDPGLPYVFLGMTLMLVGLAVQLLVPRRRKTA